MYRRFSITLLLILSMMTTALSHPFIQDDSSAVQEETKLKPEDERAARAIAIRFVKEFQKTLDVSSLVKGEMFVSDLSERLRKHPPNDSFSIPADAKVVEQASDEDLRGYFITISNICFLSWALMATEEFKRKHIEPKGNCGEETPLEKLVPIEAVNVLRSDPTFGAAIVKEMQGDDESREETESDEDSGNITSLERLKISASIWEEAASITRRHLSNLPAWQQAKRHIPYFNPELETDDEAIVSVETTKLSDDFLGLHEGENIICAHIMMFHVDLIHEGESLKILSISSNDYNIHTREEIKKAAQLGELMKAIEANDMEAFESLVRAGVDINAKGNDCMTPVVYAAMSGRLEMVKALIDLGADVNSGNRFGNTALIYAAGDGNEAMTNALLDAGANVEAKNESGVTALHLASRNKLSESHRRVVKLLESRGALQ